MKVSVRYPAALEMGHARHLLEALVRHPDVTAVVADADWSINQLGGRKAMMLYTADPHGIPRDVPNDNLADPRFLAMMTPEQRAELARGLAVFRQTNTGSLVEKSRSYEILALNSDWPFRVAIQPKLVGTGYMRAEPRVPEWIFAPGGGPRPLDGFFIGNDQPTWYPLRWRINRWYESSGLRFSYNPGRPPGDPIWRSTASFDEHQRWYADQLRQTKIVATCGSVFNIAVGKYFEAMACGCLLLAPLPHEAELLGFRSGYNMVEIGPNDFADKIRYYLARESEREEIARRGADLIRRRHTASARAADLVARLQLVDAGVPIARIEAERDERLMEEWKSQSSS